MRKVKYHVATTLDGFIAHQDHSVEGFLGEGEHVTEYLNSLRTDYDIVLMGRRTYEFGLQYGVTNPYPWLKQYIFSRSLAQSPHPEITLVSANIPETVSELKQSNGKDIYLCGGAELAATLWAAHLVEVLLVKLNPVVFGLGLPLFSGAIKQTALELTNSKVYETGVVLLEYSVKS